MYGVRSMLAFWVGGAAIPTTPTTPAPAGFIGHAGMYLVPPDKFRTFRPPKRRGFRKWKPATSKR